LFVRLKVLGREHKAKRKNVGLRRRRRDTTIRIWLGAMVECQGQDSSIVPKAART